MESMIKVGIPTIGIPEIEPGPGRMSLLKNMRIGLGFHWERKIQALLPGCIIENDDPQFQVVNILPVESYLECVVGSEMNPEAPLEFLKAHAVISRSWAMGKITGEHSYRNEGKIDNPDMLVKWEDTEDHCGFDVCSDDHCQRYQGIQPLSDNLREAVGSTAGLVLRASDGSLVDARFSKCCGGITELFSTCWQPEHPSCLESFEDPWCNLSDLPGTKREMILKSILKSYDLGNEGGYSWHTEVCREDIEAKLKSEFGRSVGRLRSLEIVERGESGRAKLLKLTGDEGVLTIGKELMIRRLLAPNHLYSSRINILNPEEGSDIYHIDGRGWGHGVGLCQIGAARMAAEGYKFDEILEFYYPGSKISL